MIGYHYKKMKLLPQKNVLLKNHVLKYPPLYHYEEIKTIQFTKLLINNLKISIISIPESWKNCQTLNLFKDSQGLTGI